MKLARTTSRPLLLVMSRDQSWPTLGDQSPGQLSQTSRELLNAYVLCKVDTNSSYGKRLAEAFRVTEFPHAVIIDKTTKKILYSKSGRSTDGSWQVTLTKYQAGQAPQPVKILQPQSTVQSRPRGYGRTYYHGQPGVAQTYRQTSTWRPSPGYGGTFSFRQPAICNT